MFFMVCVKSKSSQKASKEIASNYFDVTTLLACLPHTNLEVNKTLVKLLF